MEARERTLEVAGGTVRCREWGSEAGGTPLLMLWGAEHHAAWATVAEALAGDRRVVAIDAADMEQAREAADALGLGYCSLLGAAEAGAVTYALAAHSPGRIERLVIVDAVAGSAAVEPEVEAEHHPDQIIIPSLLVHGAASPVTLEAMRAMADRIEGATLIEVQALAHPLPEGNPRALVAAIRDFLG